MRVGVLFSGGKDSTYALFRAMENHEIKCLISVISKNKASYMFHTPNIDLVDKQAEALEVDIIKKETEGIKEEELVDLKDVIKQAKEKYGVEGIVSGAIGSRYQKERIENICKELELESITPLWGLDPEKYMRELVKEFKVIFTAIAADGLTKDWLGREIDNELIDKLVELNKKNNIHIALEGGEAETLVLDGPIFKKKIEIIDSEIKEESKHVAELIIKKVKLFSKSS